MFIVLQKTQFRGTISTFRTTVDDFGPGSGAVCVIECELTKQGQFFELYRGGPNIASNARNITCDHILSLVNLSGYDPEFFYVYASTCT